MIENSVFNSLVIELWQHTDEKKNRGIIPYMDFWVVRGKVVKSKTRKKKLKKMATLRKVLPFVLQSVHEECIIYTATC